MRLRSFATSVALLLLVLPAAARPAPGDGAPPPFWADSPDGESPSLVLDGAALSIEGEDGGVPSGLAPFFGSGCTTVDSDFLPAGDLPEGDGPSAAAYTPDGALFLVAHRDSKNVIAFDATTRAVVAVIPLSGSPIDLAVAPDGSVAVTANVWEDSASIIDLGTFSELAVVPVGDQPGLVRISPNGARAVVAATVEQALCVVDLATATETLRISGMGFTSMARITPESGVVTLTFMGLEWVADTIVLHPNFYAGTIDFVDVESGLVSAVPAPPMARGVAVTPDLATAVVTHFGPTRRATVLDTATRSIRHSIPVPLDLVQAVAVDAAGRRALAASHDKCLLLDVENGALLGTVDSGPVELLRASADGLTALGVGSRGYLIEFETGAVLAQSSEQLDSWVGATSPVADRAVAVGGHAGETVLALDTSAAAPFVEQGVSSGPDPEADRTRTAALTPDGRRAVAANILSGGVSVLDLATGEIEAVVSVGQRPAGIAITPDGARAVVACLDSNSLFVVDLDDYEVREVVISTRASEIELSPDGRYAYVAVVYADGVWRVDLDALTVDGPKLDTGNMGGVSYAFNQMSGLALSHDGGLLVTCDSFSDTLTLIDTASWTVLQTVPVPARPTRALFSKDDAELYVSCRDADAVAVVEELSSGAWALTDTIAVGRAPFEMALADSGPFLYVAEHLDRSLGVVNLAGGVRIRTIPLPARPQGVWRIEGSSCVHVASGEWGVLLGPGPAAQLLLEGYHSVVEPTPGVVAQTQELGQPPAMLAFDAYGQRAALPLPSADGLAVVRTDRQAGAVLCTGDAPGRCPCGNQAPAGSGEGCVSSTGHGAVLAATGSGLVERDDLVLHVSGGRPNAKGAFLQGLPGLGAPFGDGWLCLGSGIERIELTLTDAEGAVTSRQSLVEASGGLALPGATLRYQYWYHEQPGGGPCGGTGNLSPAIEVVWQ